MQSRSGKRAQAHLGPCRARIVECLKTTPEGAERVDRRSEVLNEALAKEVETKEVERNVRRRAEIGSATGVETTCRSHLTQTRERDVQSKQRQQLRAAAARRWKAGRAVAETPTQQRSLVGGSRMAEQQTTNDDEHINGGVTNGMKELRETNSKVRQYQATHCDRNIIGRGRK